MMRRWSFYDLETGEFVGREFCSSNEADIESSMPSGCGAIEGRHDPLTERVDLETMQIVAWRNAKRIAAVERRDVVLGARSRIASLEARQMRAMREDRLRPDDRDPSDNKTPRERLQEIDDEIAALRAVISAGTDTSERAP